MTINYKIAIIGDSETGKTTFCLRNARMQLIEDYIPTIGAVQYSEVIPRSEEQNMPPFLFDINDVSGREEDRMILPTHVKPAMTVLLFFDLSKPDTFKHIQHQYLENQTLFPTTSTKQHRVLIGNLPSSKTAKVSQHDIEHMKQNYQLEYFQIDAANSDSFKALKLHLIKQAILTLKDNPDFQPQIELENKRFADANKRYNAMWIEGNPRKSIKRILNDYAKDNNFSKLLFSCHLNRHHVKAVDTLAKSINGNTSCTHILDELNKINKSPSGTLAELTTFLCHKLDHISDHVVEQEPESNSICFFC